VFIPLASPFAIQKKKPMPFSSDNYVITYKKQSTKVVKKPSIYVSNCLPPASSYTPPFGLAAFAFFAIKTQATQKKL